jgi:peptidoglycan DL-endopeptidase CwlO
VRSMPRRRHVSRKSSFATGGQSLGGPPTARRARHGRRACAALTGAVAITAAVLSGASAQASTASSPTINQIIAKANRLSAEIDNLSEQYDGLQIQLTQAQDEVKLARENAARDAQLFTADQTYIDDIAVEGYMTGGINPSLQLLQSANAQTLLNRASILTQLEQEDGAKVSLVMSAEVAAERATAAANQEEGRATKLKAAMAATVAKIQARENFFNSKAFAQAESIYQETGHYPDIDPSGDSLGVQALRFALEMIGKPYVWGGASPSVGFDCSGLVVWAYAQVGVTLEHFTGDLWNEVVHIPYSQAKPGDLVFFYADIQHVGIYIGNGLMVDAPTFGQDVQVQPVSADPLVGTGYVPA